MRHPIFTFIELIYPFIIAICLFILMFFVKIDDDHKTNISIPVLGFSLTLPLQSKLIVRLLLGVLALGALVLPAFKDYSQFFPSHYDIDVYFDNEGINKSLLELNKKELEDLNLAKDWKEHKTKYLRKITRDLSAHLKVDDFFTNGPEYVHSTGHTAFNVEKIEKWQTYYIKEASGSLVHKLVMPNSPEKVFHSTFELLTTSNNCIKASLADIYLNWSKMLEPKFKQMASLNKAGDNIIYHHNLIACTKVTFFPIANIGNTIYLIEGVEKGTRVPIGYAIYKPSK